MKKILLIIFITSLILFPSITLAQGIVKEKGDIVVKPNEVVRGNIKLGIGNITVFGKVYGNISVLRGDIILKKGAFVSGNVITFGGRIFEEENVVVNGRKIEFPPKGNIPYKRPEIPLFLIANEGFILKIIIILLLFIFSVLFAGLFKNGFEEFVLFSKKSFLLNLPLGIIALTLFIYFTPERVIFPFGKSLFLFYTGTIYFLILMGMVSISYLIGDKLLSLFHQVIKEDTVKNIIATIIGGLFLLLLMFIPKVGIYILSLTSSVSFGIAFTYLIYRIFKV